LRRQQSEDAYKEGKRAKAQFSELVEEIHTEQIGSLSWARR
jgi:hypothetical protein